MTFRTGMLGLLAGILCAACASTADKTAAPPAPQVTVPAVITMDKAYLDYAKQQVKAGDPLLTPAYNKLIADANAALQLAPESVTYKKIMPPSGSKNDYLSLAPYWWPDPSKPDGLPYIQKDGQFNPSSKNADSDSVRNQVMCLSAQNLSLAYHFTGDARYAKKAADVIRTWFLDPKTRMNPNLKFGQAVMGRTNGRGIGLIDTRNYWMVIDAVGLIEPAKVLSASEVTDLKKWFREFSDWMLTSELGIEEFNAHNNHGTFYDMQIAAFALFGGDTLTAKRAVERGVDLRIASQVAIDGKQWAELERTTPFHYVAFNLDAMTNIARYGEIVKVEVWKKRDKTRGLKNAVNFIVPYVQKPESWPYKELRDMEEEVSQGPLLKAERAYGGGSYAKAAYSIKEHTYEAQEYLGFYDAIKQPKPTTSNVVDRLIWPVMKK